MLAGAWEAGRLQFLRLDLGERPIAMLVNFLAAPGAFWPSLLSVPASSLRMLAPWRQTSSRPITVIAIASGPPPQISSW